MNHSYNLQTHSGMPAGFKVQSCKKKQKKTKKQKTKKKQNKKNMTVSLEVFSIVIHHLLTSIINSNMAFR